MLLEVKQAEYIKDYKLHIDFNDGTEGNVDFKETIFNDKRKIFNELRDIEKFRDFNISLNTVCWCNNLDLAPEYIKEKMAEQNCSIQTDYRR